MSIPLQESNLVLYTSRLIELHYSVSQPCLLDFVGIESSHTDVCAQVSRTWYMSYFSGIFD